MRRARGYTPLALPFPADAADSILATGPFLKNTACITRGKEAFVTEHIGDTDNESTCRALAGSVKHFLNILEVSPGPLPATCIRTFIRRTLQKTMRRGSAYRLSPCSTIMRTPLPSWASTG